MPAMPSGGYGTLAPGGGGGGVGGGTRSWSSRRTAKTIAIVSASMALLILATIVSLVNRPDMSEMLQIQDAGLIAAPASPSADTKQPKDADILPFVAKSRSFIKAVGFNADTLDEDTDVSESCGFLKHPCLAVVGECLLSTSTETVEGKVTLSSNNCQCFSKGYTDAIHVETNPELQMRCSYPCLESIRAMFASYVLSKNGPSGEKAWCPTTFANLADHVYGSRNEVVPSDSDSDALEVQPLDDPKVVRAGEALLEYMNLVRRTSCPIKAVEKGSPKILYAKYGMISDQRGQYRIEIEYDGSVYAARIAHLPRASQLADPSLANSDPHNYLGRFRVMRVSPQVCEDGLASQLASSEFKAKTINQQQLSWTAQHKPQHEGKVIADFGLGLMKPSLAEKVAKTVKLSTVGFQPPTAFDARDRRENEPKCLSYDVLDQGSCGSCYAFAAGTAYSARLCEMTGRKWNIVASSQELMDCGNGCDGGWPLSLYERIADERSAKIVENFCDPYSQVKETCGGYCSNGNAYTGLQGTALIVGDETPDGIKQMQLELMQSGPGVVVFDVYDDFYSYKSGVYTKSASAKKVGGHAVVLVGWGREDGVDYWLVQNSWGKSSGDEGMWKIRRGSNECGIETYGMIVVKPEVPSKCSSVSCGNGGRYLKDCTCMCRGGWTGSSCETCSLSCKNGGQAAADCSRCICPSGFSGIDCDGGIKASPLAACEGETTLSFSYSYAGDAKPPTQKSFVGLYQLSETKSMSFVAAQYLCSTQYNANSNQGLCPSSGQISFKSQLPSGEYKVALMRYKPPNEFGQDGYSVEVTADDVISNFSSLSSSLCSDTEVKRVQQLNDPTVRLAAKVSALEASEAKEQELMNSRLDAAEAVLSKLAAAGASGPVPELRVSGMSSSNPVLWATGSQQEICYVVPPSLNLNPKALVIYEGDGSSGNYYPDGLQGAGFSSPVPDASEGCVNVVLSEGLPDGASYTLKLQKQWTPVFATVSFSLGKAYVGFEGYKYSSAVLQLTIGWSVTSSLAHPKDTVKVWNSAGSLVTWFFTSCGCQTEPGTGTSAQGQKSIEINREGAVLGGYKLGLFPGGGDVKVAVGDQWIEWKTIGW
uniref:Uncharacterized protein n=1 Tax=Hanusia phi TaxID=3032 RepID=A0A7S0HL70_9CRYP|mmetsp:Transcript_26408/g.60057  ORF Transcript_26408/g.60057 Transcript_26408/m.60057 type:complete len:1103 (+) Transcript_26408:29-3337(+)